MIKISSLLFVMVAMMLSACDDYLDDVPKGQKIPKTWEDYNAFIRNNFSYHFLDPDQLAVLAGDIFKLPSAVTSPSLTRANYYADESVNRIDLMTGNDKNPYFNAYEGLCVESNRRGCTGCDRMYGGSAPSVNSSGTCS